MEADSSDVAMGQGDWSPQKLEEARNGKCSIVTRGGAALPTP